MSSNARRAVLSLSFLLMMTTRLTAAEPSKSALDSFLSSVQRTVLPNGLTLLVRPQPGTGVVAINTWVKAGYFHEPDEVAGMAHLFEHMFFKGSKSFPGAEQISQELSSVGGQTNAGTIYDSTNYYFVLPAANFKRGIEIQADAIMNPLFDAAELKKESEVVIEESNRKLDNPPAVSIERMLAVAFTDHRVKRWRIGSNEVLRNIKRENLYDFFQTLYRPENIILTVTGDVTPGQVQTVVAESFGKLPKGALKKMVGPVEPAQKEFRFGQSSADMQSGYSVLGWHTSPVGAQDDVELEVLTQILGGGRSSRLYRGVIGPDAASTVNASNYAFEEVGMLVLQASFDEKNRNEVDRRMLREVARLAAHGPTNYELQLARNQIESDLILGLESVLGQAQALSYAEANFGYRGMGTRLARLAGITPARIQAVAAKYLRDENLTLYHYQPTGAKKRSREEVLPLVTAARGGNELRSEKELALTSASRSVGRAKETRKPVEMKLSNGATLVVEERPGAPSVVAAVYFRGGRIGESSLNAGTTDLMMRVMRRGTRTRNAEQVNREIEYLGTQITTTNLPDYFGLELGILSRNLTAGLDVLSDVLLNPAFLQKDLDEEKHLQLGAIKRAADSAQQRPLQLLYATYYGNHPYGLPSSGFASSVTAVEREALVAWWKRWVVADDALIVMAGDISAAEARKLAEASFGKLAKRSVKAVATPQVTPPQSRMETVEYRKRKQSAIAVAYPGAQMTNEDWPKLRLLESVISGLAGTFFAELRGNRSLAYTVFGGESTQREAGVFLGYLAGEASKEVEAKKALVDEFKRLDKGGFSAADVERAKAYVAGSTLIARQTNGSHAADIAEKWMFGLSLDFTDRLLTLLPGISMEQMQAIAKKYFEGDNYSIAVVSGN
ncbi:MAG TPA: pitrilysin family protein [Thermoanaerobaculia bacterium]|nr:pitrilysin family protein [Thermoanaerobaculia bacterium]